VPSRRSRSGCRERFLAPGVIGDLDDSPPFDAEDVEELAAEIRADFVLLCTNTMHRVAPELEQALAIPLVHIADATAEAIEAAGIARVGLLGTRYTMEQDFYRGRLEDRHRLGVIVPEEPARTLVHDVIYDELVLGRVEESSRAAFAGIIGGLVDEGAEAIVLGCTEIGLLVGEADAPVPLFDTTRIHAERAVELALQ
jgi:aspartate racemase